MGFSSPFSQSVGQYQPSSIAARGPVQIPSSKRRGTAASDGSAYRQAATAPTRADNIAASRADGTFDAKRNAFNAANKSSFMDSQGNIGPKAEMPSPTAPQTASAPAAPPSTGAPAPAPAPAKTRGPATFDGKSESQFFGAAMAKYGPTAGVSVYGDQETKAVASNGGKALPAPSNAPTPAKPTSAFAAAGTPPKPYAGPMARPPGQVDTKPSSPSPAGKSSFASIPSTKDAPQQTSSLPAESHASPQSKSEPTLDELKAKADAAKEARTPGYVKAAKATPALLPGSQFVKAAQTVNRFAPAVASSATSAIKSGGDTVIKSIDKGMAPARRWLYGSDKETPEEKAYAEALAKQPKSVPEPKKKPAAPTFRKPYMPNRAQSFSMN